MIDNIKIFLITYNRKEKLEKTLNTVLDQNSPIKDFDITILDNASTDGTSELIEKYCQKYSNLKHIRHDVNIGGNANICRAFEMGASCGKEYLWVLCDDDKFDFSNWGEVEKLINEKTDIICVSDYAFPSNVSKSDPAYQIFQLTFVPAGIYKSSLITDDVLVNMYDAIIMMFQQSVVTIKCINENKKVHVLSRPIVFNGLHFEDKVDNVSLSFKRGGSEKWVMERRKNTLWILGYANILTLLDNMKLKNACIEVAIQSRDIYGNEKRFFDSMLNDYINMGYNCYFEEIYANLSENKKKCFDNYRKKIIEERLSKIERILRRRTLKNFIFSIERTEKYFIVTILWLTLKIKKRSI